MNNLPPILSRLLALALLVCALGLLWFGAVEPVRQSFAWLADEKARLLDLRDRYKRAAGGVEALKAARDKALAGYAEHPGLLDEPSAAAAAAAMQTELKRAVQAAGGELRRVVVAPPEAGAGAERIGLKVLATLDLAGLSALLYALEIENPLYRIGDLRIEPTRAARKGAEKERLTVVFDLYAYRRRPLDAAAIDGPQADPAPAFRRIGDG